MLQGRVGLAGGRSDSVKKLVVFVIRPPLGLRRGCPGLGGARAQPGRRAPAGRNDVTSVGFS